MRRILKFVWVIKFLTCLIFLQGCGGKAECYSQAKKTKTPYKFRPFSFAYSNATRATISLGSATVLAKDLRCGRVWAGGVGSSIGDTRKDCTPEALLRKPAQFVWWKISDPFDMDAIRAPKDPFKEVQQSITFPEFDVEATAWRCHYTLVDDKTWVGKFSGTLAKTPGAAAKPVLNGDGNSWLHCHFRNLANKEVFLSKWETKILTNEHEFEPGIRFLPADKRFHGFSANCQEGSIYRLEAGDSLQIAWAFEKKDLNTRAMKKQTFLMPEFDAKKKNWYCYFTINEKEEWTATFEGTTKDAESLDK